MKLTEFSILADENIQPAVIAFLREQGLDVFSFPELVSAIYVLDTFKPNLR